MIDTFENRFRHICEVKNLSVLAACNLIGINYKTLLMQFKRKSKISHETVDDICHFLDLPPNYFSKHAPVMGISAQPESDQVAHAAASLMDTAINAAHMQALRRQSKITTMDVLNWLRRTDGRLEDYDAIKRSVDLFHVMGAEDQIPEPFDLGPNSLSTEFFGIEGNEHYKRRLEEFDTKVLEGIKIGRLQAAKQNYAIADVRISQTVAGRLVEEMYCRLIAKVYLPNNRELTLVHSELIPNNHRSDRGSTDLDLIQQPSNRAISPLVSGLAK